MSGNAPRGTDPETYGKGSWDNQTIGHWNDDGYRSYLFQGQFTGNWVETVGNSQFNAEKHGGLSGDDPDYDTFDIKIVIEKVGDNSYAVTGWLRLWKSSAIDEGYPWDWNYAMNAHDPAKRDYLMAFEGTWIADGGIDLSDAEVFLAIQNWQYTQPTLHTFDWDSVVVTGTVVPPAEVWVDDDWAALNPGDPADEYVFGYDAFATIQDGIDAVAGSTVNVAAGTYTELVTIDKANVTVKSESQGAAIIKPSAEREAWPYGAVLITADGVTFDGFEVDGTTICNNGINAYEANNVTIRNNIVHGAVNDWDGVGITVWSWGSGTVDGALIENNEVYDTGRMGIIVLDHNGSSYEVTSNHIIRGNTVHDTWKVGWDDHGGSIQINVGKNSSIVDNVIYDTQNGERGIYMFGSAAGNTITGNTIRDNPIGVQLWISGEGGDSINWGDDAPTSPDVSGNDIYDNGTGAISSNIEGTPMVMDAAMNWWGHRTGPKQADNNPDGKGDEVSANVYYEPWLTKVSEEVLAEGVGYYGFAMVHLGTGWNILSTPFALDTDCDTWGEFVTLNELSEKLAAVEPGVPVPTYYYDAAVQDWGQVTSGYQLKPCDAIYVKMAQPDIAALLVSPGLSTPQKTLRRGWNLVGLSWQPTETAGPVAKASDYLKTVETVGTLPGYTLVVSPGQNQEPWTYVAGGTIAPWQEEQPNPDWMVPTKGYWVVMENGPDVLYGTWLTPMGLPGR